MKLCCFIFFGIDLTMTLTLFRPTGITYFNFLECFFTIYVSKLEKKKSRNEKP